MSPKNLYLIANWKSHKTLDEATRFFDSLQNLELNPQVKNIIAPPAPYLQSLLVQVTDSNVPIILAAQSISPFPFGAYTGEVSAAMVKDWAHYVIVGHSERRKYFHESYQDVANKIAQILEHNLTPILCVDEPYMHAQFDALGPENIPQLIVAYEPLTAIGSGDPDTPEHAAKIATQIKEIANANLPVLYGGSVTADNVHTFTSLPEINGALVGGASLDPESWQDLINAAA